MPNKKPLYKATLIDIGRNKVNKEIFFNKTTELHKEIKKHIASPGWGLEETEITGTYVVSAGFRTVGSVIVSEVKTIPDATHI